MKALFVRKSGAGYLLTALVLLSIATMAVENNTRLLEPFRERLVLLLAPVYFVAELPYQAGTGLGDVVATREALITETREQQLRLVELGQAVQRFRALEAENARLRQLLGSRARVSGAVVVAELIGVVPAPDTRQIILDKGAGDGVRVGAPVVDAFGIFGRVVEVSAISSRVLLLTDVNHAIPVQINRNGIRSIAGGTGDARLLELENVPVTADIEVGDLVETSGLGGSFPIGYPVGRVVSVRIEPTSAFTEVVVEPLALLDRSRYLLVLLEEPEQLPALAAPATAAPSGTDAVGVQPDAGVGEAP